MTKYEVIKNIFNNEVVMNSFTNREDAVKYKNSQHDQERYKIREVER